MTKVRNAQRDNATAVLIADNTCLCGFPEDVCTTDVKCEDSEPTMDDDGTGSDIQIPSMLLLKPDADRIKNELIAGQTMSLQISWPIPKATNGRTEYTLWMTPDDIMDHHFLFTFAKAALSLGDRAYFRPRMFVHDGEQRGCREYEGSSIPCLSSCTNFGRYCEPRSYFDFEVYDNKGTKMVVESLRRTCIWQIYGEADGIGIEWWTYNQLWIQRCSTSRFSSSCAEGLYDFAGIDKELVEKCIVDSGDFRRDVPNRYFDANLAEASEYEVTFAPTLFINGAVIRGSLSFGSVLEAICMTYDDDIPEVCYTWEACEENCPSDKTCVLDGGACIEYSVPEFADFTTTWDDDYLDQEWEEYLPDSPTDAPLPAPTVVPVMDPTLQPTQSANTPPSLPPVVVQTTAAPQSTPTSLPTLPPAPAPKEEPSPEFNTPLLPNTPTSGMVETIQIFEGGRGPGAPVDLTGGFNGASNSTLSGSFIIGLTAGILGAFVLTLLVILLIREKRGYSGRGIRRRIYAREPMEYGEYELEDGFYEGQDEFDDELVELRPSRSRIIPQRLVRQHRPPKARRTNRRSHRRIFESHSQPRKESSGSLHQMDEEEWEERRSSSRAARHKRTWNENEEAEELVSLQMNDSDLEGVDEDFEIE